MTSFKEKIYNTMVLVLFSPVLFMWYVIFASLSAMGQCESYCPLMFLNLLTGVVFYVAIQSVFFSPIVTMNAVKTVLVFSMYLGSAIWTTVEYKSSSGDEYVITVLWRSMILLWLHNVVHVLGFVLLANA